VSRRDAKMLSKTFFVTGATGFIGQRLLMKLKAKGTWLKVLSRSHHSEYETVICDMQREVIPDGALEGVNTIFHLSGFAHDLRDASKLEGLYRKVNVDATVQLAELAVSAGVRHFVFVSSVKAGGRNGDPEGIYGKTKREAELRLLEIAQRSSMHIAVVRPSLVYGSGVKGNLKLMRSGIEKGWFPPLPESGNRRSMIHVDDLIQALLLVAKDRRTNGEIYIATDGEPHSSRKIYEAICHSVGKPIPNWSVPKFLFKVLAKLSPKLRYNVDKLLGDEEYSSDKLEKLGFRAEKSLMDFDT
jgi:UDP-glucose 4-epimerase